MAPIVPPRAKNGFFRVFELFLRLGRLGGPDGCILGEMALSWAFFAFCSGFWAGWGCMGTVWGCMGTLWGSRRDLRAVLAVAGRLVLARYGRRCAFLFVTWFVEDKKGKKNL